MTACRFRLGLTAALALSFSLAHAEPDRASPPRLTAIVIGGGERVAVFAESGGTLSVREGERVGLLIVAAIRPDEVMLTSPSGTVTVQPSADLGIRSLWAGRKPVRPLIAPSYREAVTETDQ